MYKEKIIAGAITGTTFMTLFSYIVAALEKDNFKEPELLGKLGHRLIPQSNKTVAQLAGWNLHYAVGLLFVIAYASLWECTQWKPGIKSGLFLGAVSGLVGILGWKFVFKNHPNPPIIDFQKFYRQLIVAHCIFGITAAIGYKLSKQKEPGV